MKNENIKSYTHIALILDASGSMTHLRNGTVSTMKGFFEALKSPEDRTLVDLWQFDDRVRHLIDGADIDSGATEAIENYSTGGCTALYDAICIGIDELGAKFAAMSEADRPDAVVFAILTDGFENASEKYTVKDVKERIVHQTEKYSWEFRFLAANQDAVLTGAEMGLRAKACMTFDASDKGIMRSCRMMAKMCCSEVRGSARQKRLLKRMKSV